MEKAKLSEEQVFKASVALLKYIKMRRKAEEAKTDSELLFEEEIPINLYFIIHRECEGPRAQRKFRHHIKKKIKIPHSIWLEKDICLIAGYTEADKERAIKMLEEIPVPQVKKVIHAGELSDKFCQHKDRKTLCHAYDLFVTEHRLIPNITHLLGGEFFERVKQPVSIRLGGKFQYPLMKLLYCTFAVRPIGNQMCVKMGTDAFTAQQITDNVMASYHQIVKFIPDGWCRIRKIGISMPKAPLFIIYQALFKVKYVEPMVKQRPAEKTKEETQITGDDDQVAKQNKDDDKKEVKHSKGEDKMETESTEENKTKPAEEDVEMVSKSGEEDSTMKIGSD